MQNNDTRLFKAAKRTFRAEVTLFIFIALITSWSIYALYTLSTGNTDSILGLKLAKLFGGTEHKINKTIVRNKSSDDILQRPLEANQLNFYMRPEEIKIRGDLLRNLIATRQRQLYQQQIAKLALQSPTAMAALQQLRLTNQLPMVNRQHNYLPEASNDQPKNWEEDETSDVESQEKPDQDGAEDENSDIEDHQQDDQPQSESKPVEDIDDEQKETSEEPQPEEQVSSNDDNVDENSTTTQDDSTNLELGNNTSTVEGQDGEDRISQASLGVASRQDQPYDYKRMVQFDDSPQISRSGSIVKETSPSARSGAKSFGTVPRIIAAPIEEPKKQKNRRKQPDLVSKGSEITSLNDSNNSTRTSRVKRSYDDKQAESLAVKLADHILSPTIGSNSSVKAELIKTKGLSLRRNGKEDDGYEDLSDTDRKNDAKSRYHYLTTNDANLQELLTQQKLLDALTQSQLPAPSLKSTVTSSNKETKKKSASGSEPSYSIDPALLLTQAIGDGIEDDEFDQKEHKSSMKKKMEKSKSKKKIAMGLKKGGHKKKVHKKEEKKYLKEKKFKGAKKGKKSSKRKGTKGGKKGKKFYKDKGFKKKGFKNVYHKEEFGQKKSYFDEFRDKDFKKKWKKYDDKYKEAKMKKWQAKDVKGAKKMKDHGEKYKKYDKGKWKKKYMKDQHEAKKKKKSSEDFR